jgi:hypothetical protein
LIMIMQILVYAMSGVIIVVVTCDSFSWVYVISAAYISIGF